MTDASLPTDERSTPREWLIRKRGYYYRPNRCGYTSCVASAGRYTEAEAKAEAAIEPDCMSAIHQNAVSDETPEVPTIPPKEGTCGHPALYTWHYTTYARVPECLYCKAERLAPEPGGQRTCLPVPKDGSLHCAHCDGKLAVAVPTEPRCTCRDFPGADEFCTAHKAPSSTKVASDG